MPQSLRDSALRRTPAHGVLRLTVGLLSVAEPGIHPRHLQCELCIFRHYAGLALQFRQRALVPAAQSEPGNGSEFLNHQVEKIFNKLLVEFTKSRAYWTTDNALVEGKNRGVVRQRIGYGAIGAEYAAAFKNSRGVFQSVLDLPPAVRLR